MRAERAVPAYEEQTRSVITHDVFYDYDSWDLLGHPCVEVGSFQAYSAEQAEALESLCKRDSFKRNVRVVPRGGK